MTCGFAMKSLAEIFPNPSPGANPAALDMARIPVHVAIIMDGNGRWAKARGGVRLNGHKAGIEAVREAIRTCNDLGVRYLTIYSFSTENWSRPADEVNGLMNLFATTMLAEVDELDEENVRVMTIGHTEALPEKTRNAFAKAWEQTRNNTGLTLVVAVNYGGRAEILDAARAWGERCAAATAAGESLPDCTEEAFLRGLYTGAAGIPDPELILRTSGEMRLSNFLLWQAAYAEFVSLPVLWPDFTRYDLLEALLEYQSRDRRFGGAK